jgi:hypothetical protein
MNKISWVSELIERIKLEVGIVICKVSRRHGEISEIKVSGEKSVTRIGVCMRCREEIFNEEEGI